MSFNRFHFDSTQPSETGPSGKTSWKCKREKWRNWLIVSGRATLRTVTNKIQINLPPLPRLDDKDQKGNTCCGRSLRDGPLNIWEGGEGGLGKYQNKLEHRFHSRWISVEKTNRALGAELPKSITKKYWFHVIRPKRSQSEDHLQWEKKVVQAHICEKKISGKVLGSKIIMQKRITHPLLPPPPPPPPPPHLNI